ncbi:MAG: hypothetical protein ACLRI7_05715 [Ruthenibacterium lactatiformans]
MPGDASAPLKLNFERGFDHENEEACSTCPVRRFRAWRAHRLRRFVLLRFCPGCRVRFRFRFGASLKEVNIGLIQLMEHASLDEIRTAIEAGLEAKGRNTA